ncbi:hypothetical protein ACJIZ3_003612 [Penstemon smallii]|uniref:TTF-type domain-containing protein n=1 Tax=Penstemon smallii TaxID=265156 RepID=A0ABD3U9Q0_9LAMI
MKRHFKATNTPTPYDDPSTSSRIHIQSDSHELPNDQIEMNLPELPSDPGLRPHIMTYHPNIRERVIRKYLLKGPCQPRNIEFPKTYKGGQLRRFSPTWYNGNANWLEYSENKDAVFCLCCYLFKADLGDQGGGDAFITEGYSNWKKKERLAYHVGRDSNSIHNRAWEKCQALLDQKQQIEPMFNRLAFRGHDESEFSSNQGNFLELLSFLADQNEVARAVILGNAPENLKLIAPSIQKDIVNACSIETTNAIIRELGDELFAILVDESRDISCREQMTVVLRYVDSRGYVMERVIGIKHVKSTTALSLKESIDDLFSTYGLSIDRLRGQGYDGASNMQGEFNGLKALILRENQTRKCPYMAGLFDSVTMVVNIFGGSPKRRDFLLDKQYEKVVEALSNNKIESGQGLNQERTLVRASDTRWGSHYGTLMSLVNMFPSVIDVLGFIVEESTDKNREASNLLLILQSFSFVFNLYLMTLILGITNDLSQALQRKDQDIVNAMRLVKVSKDRLQETRDEGWAHLLEEVTYFCSKYEIEIPSMTNVYVPYGRPRRRNEQVTVEHHYKVERFNSVIDRQMQELNNRFNEKKLVRLAELYPNDFSFLELSALPNQLENYIRDVRSSEDFSNLKGIGDLAQKLVATKRHITFSLVYKLVTLSLILPVATASVERAFSAMKMVKNRLRNRMGDQWLNDSLVVFIERDIFSDISNDAIIDRFQKMKNRRGVLF